MFLLIPVLGITSIHTNPKAQWQHANHWSDTRAAPIYCVEDDNVNPVELQLLKENVFRKFVITTITDELENFIQHEIKVTGIAFEGQKCYSSW